MSSIRLVRCYAITASNSSDETLERTLQALAFIAHGGVPAVRQCAFSPFFVACCFWRFGVSLAVDWQGSAFGKHRRWAPSKWVHLSFASYMVYNVGFEHALNAQSAMKRGEQWCNSVFDTGFLFAIVFMPFIIFSVDVCACAIFCRWHTWSRIITEVYPFYSNHVGFEYF